MKKLFLLISFILALSATASAQLVLGNPSGADTTDKNNFLVIHSGYILSYNRERGTSNWFAWHLEQDDIGTFDGDAFAPDTTLPLESQIKPSVYFRSGFDKGHLCPAKDRSKTLEANRETYLMSNIQPQTVRLNQVTWKSLETFTRTQIEKGDEAYIYAGCYGSKGRLKDQVTIPESCWKIVVLLPTSEKDFKRITKDTRVIAVDIPNADDLKNSWREYIFSVKAIEERTGFDFFSTLKNDIETALEVKVEPR